MNMDCVEVWLGPSPALGPRLRQLADEAWERGSKELSDMLHAAARKAEAEERGDDQAP